MHTIDGKDEQEGEKAFNLGNRDIRWRVLVVVRVVVVMMMMMTMMTL